MLGERNEAIFSCDRCRRPCARARSRAAAIYAAAISRRGGETRISALFVGWLGARSLVAEAAGAPQRRALAALSRRYRDRHDRALSQRRIEHRSAARR